MTGYKITLKWTDAVLGYKFFSHADIVFPGKSKIVNSELIKPSLSIMPAEIIKANRQSWQLNEVTWEGFYLVTEPFSYFSYINNMITEREKRCIHERTFMQPILFLFLISGIKECLYQLLIEGGRKRRKRGDEVGVGIGYCYRAFVNPLGTIVDGGGSTCEARWI